MSARSDGLSWLGSPRLLVLGDLMLDRYCWGEAERVSPEGPALVLRRGHEDAWPGGAGAVARMAAALGARVSVAGVVGDDSDGPVPTTTLYLVRHGATPANLAEPPRLQGRGQDPPLAAEGWRQAEAAREALRCCPISAAYTSPLLRAVQTTNVVLAPHGLTAQVLPALTECDVGHWEGLTWQEVQQRQPVAHARFLADPWHCPYPGGESLADVNARVAPALEELLRAHAGQALLVVAHQVVLRAYLTPLLGLPLHQARRLPLGNGSITVLVRHGADTTVRTLDGRALLGD
jgi:broad specificity phosphatase PhoE